MRIYPVAHSGALPALSNHCYGIDLGTTYCLMAMVDPAEVDLQRSNQVRVKFIRFNQHSPNAYDASIEDEKVASIVALVDGKPYIGNNLYHLKGSPGMEYQKNLFYHWKGDLGLGQDRYYNESISPKLDMPCKVAGLILKYMRATHLRDKDRKMENTVITVPASFQANQRQDVKRAAEIGGISASDRLLIDEPNAAFLGYFNRLSEAQKKHWASAVRNKNVLVIDFGGGTLDLSIIHVNFSAQHGMMLSNLAISRYNDLGGQDVDHLLVEELLHPKIIKKFPRLGTLDDETIQRSILPQLSVFAEQLKCGISDKIALKVADKDIREINLTGIDYTLDDIVIRHGSEIFELGSLTFGAQEYQQLFTKLCSGRNHQFKLIDKVVTSLNESIQELIDKTNLYRNNIHYALFVGGSSLNPLLQSEVMVSLPSAEPLSTHQPDKLVAEGAAVFSYFYHQHGIELIRPITSDAIGIRTKGKHFKTLIPAGTPLPHNIEIRDLMLQSNVNSEVVVPVCVRSQDCCIGVIRCQLETFYEPDSNVSILASLNNDKIFEVSIVVDGDRIGSATFDNPLASQHLDPNQLAIEQLRTRYERARATGIKEEEVDACRELIYKYSKIDNSQAVIDCAKEYVKRLDPQDDSIWNLLFCHHNRLGQLKQAKQALKKAMELEPTEPAYIYNYSLVLSKHSDGAALDYLEEQPEWIKEDNTIQAQILILKSRLGYSVEMLAREMVKQYQTEPELFSEFEKNLMLPRVFKLAGKNFNPADIKRSDGDDDKLYLAINEPS